MEKRGESFFPRQTKILLPSLGFSLSYIVHFTFTSLAARPVHCSTSNYTSTDDRILQQGDTIVTVAIVRCSLLIVTSGPPGPGSSVLRLLPRHQPGRAHCLTYRRRPHRILSDTVLVFKRLFDYRVSYTIS